MITAHIERFNKNFKLFVQTDSEFTCIFEDNRYFDELLSKILNKDVGEGELDYTIKMCKKDNLHRF